jgi:hypothetical protein
MNKFFEMKLNNLIIIEGENGNEFELDNKEGINSLKGKL